MSRKSLLSAAFALSMLLACSGIATAQDAAVNEIQQLTGPIIHLGTHTYTPGGLHIQVNPEDFGNIPEIGGGTVVYDNTTGTGFFSNRPPGQEIVDSADLPDGTNVGEFQIGFVSDAVGSVTMRYTFYQTNLFDSITGILQGHNGSDAQFVITVSGLPGGGLFGFTVNIVLEPEDHFVITGPDVDAFAGTDWGWSYASLDIGTGTALGPLITTPGGGPGAPGSEDLFDRYDPPLADGGTYTNTFNFGGFPVAAFHMQLIEGVAPFFTIPTLSEYGLGLMVLLLMGAAVVMMRRSV